MGKRRLPRGRTGRAVGTGILVAIVLAGCQSASGRYTSVDARAASRSATTVALAGISLHRRVLSDTYVSCPSDTGFFASSSTWRTVTRVDTGVGGAAAVRHRILATMAARGWHASAARNGITTLTPPHKSASPAHVARIRTDVESTAVVLTVFSRCYGS